MNRYYQYDNIELWEEKRWESKISTIYPLIQWLGNNEKVDDTPYAKPVDGLYGEDCRVLPFYDRKTNCVSIPEVVKYWNDRGVHYERRSQGGLTWLIMCPTKCLSDYSTKLKTLVVMHRENILDPYWAMKTLDRYKSYNDMVAEDQDLIIVYICSNGPDVNRVYVNILQEAYVFVPGDTREVYFDVSAVYDSGFKISQIPGFTYVDANGAPVADPDSCVTKLGKAQVPVLDITGRWENRCSLSRDQISKLNWSCDGFDLSKTIHCETGRRIAEGMVLEYQFDTVEDPGFIAYWDRMGLNYESHNTKLRRWTSCVPKSTLEDRKKIPAICVMQEVNRANEHLAVTEASYFYEYFRIAAQGQCILINFVLEDPEGNEILEDILKEAIDTYPIDPARVYIAGHSHNGHYSLEFASRHPNLIAAVATFGNSPGLQNSGITPMTPERAAVFSKVDMPVIILNGCKESGHHYPMLSSYTNAYGIPVNVDERIADWQLRLKVSNCPMKTDTEIRAAANSDNYAMRMLGIPGDWGETIWVDGLEVYIVDTKNNNGKIHLRVVGEENMPHNTSPVQQELSWSFMRRFARNQETGEIVELY